MRLKHPNTRPAGAPVRFRFDGAEIEALTGETIAAALAAADIVAVRRTRSGAIAAWASASIAWSRSMAVPTSAPA
jgi:hypothetical protein